MLLSLGALMCTSLASAAEPIVTNVRAAQRAGTKLVDVYYDVMGETSALSVSVQVSLDGGASIDMALKSLSGDVGTGVKPGTNRHVIWNAGTDWNEQISTTVRFKVTASDGPALAAPALLLPANNARTFNRRPTFSWNAVAGATSYRIIIKLGGQDVVNTTVTGGTSFVPSASMAVGTYQWHVAAIYEGAEGPFSDTRSLVIQKVPGGGEF